jgi:hypothetical protein
MGRRGQSSVSRPRRPIPDHPRGPCLRFCVTPRVQLPELPAAMAPLNGRVAKRRLGRGSLRIRGQTAIVAVAGPQLSSTQVTLVGDDWADAAAVAQSRDDRLTAAALRPAVYRCAAGVCGVAARIGVR